MAVNPMQKKARNSFLLGVLITLLIAGVIIIFLFMQLQQEKTKQQQIELSYTNVYTLGQDVKSGQVITSNMINIKQVVTSTVPTNAVTDMAQFTNYALHDKNGNEILTDSEGLYITRSNNKIRIEKDENGYFETNNNTKSYIELLEAPLIAKTDMKANTVVSLDLIAKSDEIATADMRLQEYNTIIIPSQLQIGDYIDIRLMLPNGLDYIVVSKKKIQNMTKDTVWLNVNEDEILAIDSAIIDSYKLAGSKLYANTYVEAGVQDKAAETYIVSNETLQLMDSDSNILAKAKQELYNRYSQDSAKTQRNNIQGEINKVDEDEQKTNIQSGVSADIEKAKEEREAYFAELEAVQQ